MSEVNNIFELPPIVVEKVRLGEILELLRKRVNKYYMPSSHGEVQYNSKPSYVKGKLPEHSDFANVHHSEWSGYFSVEDLFGGSSKPIYFNLRISQFQILVNLETEQAIVCLVDAAGSPINNKFFVWTDSPEQTIPLMRDELKEYIETYG